MFNKKKTWFVLVALVSILAVGLVGCGTDEEPADENGEEEVAEVYADGVITGIDAGAGIMGAAADAVDVYDLDYELLESSDAMMTAALADAIDNEEEIIVTGWAPHWKFGVYDLKFLEDPEGTFGGAETINTIARLGLEDDKPVAYEILDNFFWDDSGIAVVMDMNADGMDPADSAREWVDNNQDVVAEWIPEGANGEGTIEFGYVAWDCAIASTNVMAVVLEDVGYDVEITDLGAGLLYEGLAQGDVDVMTTAWLPFTHESYMEDYGDQLDDLGPNYEGARIGLVVPEYMEIDSIEDL